MKLTLTVEDARAFVDEAQLAAVTYHRVRRVLYEKFIESLREVGPIRLSFEDFYAIKGFLDSRNEDLNDNKRLSFDKTIVNIELMIRLQPRGFVAAAAHMIGAG